MFEWDGANVDHITAHGVSPDEAEEAILDPRHVPMAAYAVPGERRQAVVGMTEDLRLIFVVFTRRGPAIRVITARDASPKQRRRYRR